MGAISALVRILSFRHEDPMIRGQAPEAIGSQLEHVRHQRQRRFLRVIEALGMALTDSAPEVRFWCIYALVNICEQSARPELERLAATDDGVCLGMWSVREEASGALYCLDTEDWPVDLGRGRERAGPGVAPMGQPE
jgi:hypothetical protein